jgi:DNA-binding PadR family transcriptional regulator
MPATKPTPEPPPSEGLLLAAIDRAYRHRRRRENPGVRLASAKEHLGLARGSASTRCVRPVWDALHAAGLIEPSEPRGQPLWRLTSAGVERLQTVRQSGELKLPESPQHRDWREARSAANKQIAGFRNELRTALADTADLLVIEPPTNSDSWREAGERLQTACSGVSWAVYCLSEWAEPSVAHWHLCDQHSASPHRLGQELRYAAVHRGGAPLK